jgi:hypothetical protein
MSHGDKVDQEWYKLHASNGPAMVCVNHRAVASKNVASTRDGDKIPTLLRHLQCMLHILVIRRCCGKWGKGREAVQACRNSNNVDIASGYARSELKYLNITLRHQQPDLYRATLMKCHLLAMGTPAPAQLD